MYKSIVSNNIVPEVVNPQMAEWSTPVTVHLFHKHIGFNPVLGMLVFLWVLSLSSYLA